MAAQPDTNAARGPQLPGGIKPWGLLAAIVALVAVLVLPLPAGLSQAGEVTLAILAFSVILWMTEAVDYAVSAVIIAALLAGMLGMSPDAAKGGTALLGTAAGMSMALGGFATSAWAVVTAACFLAAAMQITGLDRRIALLVLSAVGAKSRNVVMGSIIVGAILAFLVPSTTARVACIIPIMSGMIAAFGVSRNSRFAGMLMITTSQIASIWNVGIKTAAAQNMVAIGFIEKQLGTTITWLEWLIAAAPFALLCSVGLYFIMTRMMPPEMEEFPGGREAIRKALADLGPVKTSEIKVMVISCALLLLWATEGVLHKFDTSLTTMSAAALLLAPYVGVMEWKAAQSKIPWGTVVLFGVGISLGTALLQTKAAGWLANNIVTAFSLGSLSTLAVLLILGAFLVVVHLGFASATALASAMIPIMIGVVLQLKRPDMNSVGMVMLLQFVVSFGFILPVNAPQSMLAYGTDTFTVRDFVKTGLAIMAMACAVFLLMSLTYWRWLGYVA